MSAGDDYWYTGPRLEISLAIERDRLHRLEAEADAQRARIEWIEDGRVGVHEIHDLGVGVRISTALSQGGVFHVSQLARFTRAELDTIKGIGAKALDTIEFALLVHGYVLECEPADES